MRMNTPCRLGLIWLLSVAGAGCTTSTFVGTSSVLADSDGDGFLAPSAGGADCDDTDPEVNPAAVEVCGDFVDNDCNGVVDDNGIGAITWYPDSDGDGFGTDQGSQLACPSVFVGQPFATLGGDCDDGNPDIRPNAVDICDGVDQDCDETIDEDALTATYNGVAYGTVGEAIDAASEATGQAVVEVCGHAPPVDVAETLLVDGGRLVLRGIGAADGVRPLMRPSAEVETLVRLTSGAELTVENVNFQGVKSGATEALLMVDGDGDLRLSDVDITDHSNTCVAGQSNRLGVVALSLTRANVSGCGASSTDGGAVGLSGTFEFDCTSSTLFGNHALAGGGVYAEDTDPLARPSSITLDGCQISENSAGVGGGGGLHLQDISAVTLTNSHVLMNTALSGGGAHLTQVELTGDGKSSIAENKASFFGGGIVAVGILLEDVLVTANEARSGGGVYAANRPGRQDEAFLTNIVLTGNTADDEGGGLYVSSDGAASMFGGTVLDNSAGFLGGGVYIDASAFAYLIGDDVGFFSLTDDNSPDDLTLRFQNESTMSYTMDGFQGTAFTCNRNGCNDN